MPIVERATRSDIQARAIVSEDTPIGEIRCLCKIYEYTHENPDDFVQESAIHDHEAKVYKSNSIHHMKSLLYSRRWIINRVPAGSTFRVSTEGERWIHSAFQLLNHWQKQNGHPVTPMPGVKPEDMPPNPFKDGESKSESALTTAPAPKDETPKAEPSAKTSAKRPGTPA